MRISLSGVTGDSIVDGPGLRLTIFTQGCLHNCPGCHNPGTHDPAGGREVSVAELAAELSAGVDAPDFQDACPALGYDWTANDYRYFDAARRELGLDYPANLSKLLGWPDIIQNNMTLECELVSRGHYLGGRWESVPMEERDQLRKPSVEGWQLLFQLDTVESGGFELMFGLFSLPEIFSKWRRIYFYIRNEDLAARRFDRVWLIQQCC